MEHKTYLANTGAGRLVKILAPVPDMKVPDNAIFSTWVQLFGVPESPSSLAIGCAIKTSNLIKRISREMDSLDIDKDLYTSTLSSLLRAFEEGIMSRSQFQNFQRAVTHERIEVLKWCALFLEQKEKILFTDQGVVNSLAEKTRTLLEDIENSAHPPVVVEKIKAALNDVLQALKDFEIFGEDIPPSIFVKFATEVVSVRDTVEAPENKNVKGKILQYLKDVSALLGGANAAFQLAKAALPVIVQ